MADKPKQVQEVVWTGTSDRKIEIDAELFDPGKSSKGKLLKSKRESEKPGNRGAPLYPKDAEQPPAPKKAAAPRKKAAPKKAATGGRKTPRPSATTASSR